MVHGVRPQEAPQGLQTLAADEKDGLTKVAHTLELDESRVSIRFAVPGDGLTEDVSADPSALGEIGAVHIPGDHIPDEGSTLLLASAMDGTACRHFTQLSKTD